MDRNTARKPQEKHRRVVLDGVEIVFSWQDDRWSHTIHFPQAGSSGHFPQAGSSGHFPQAGSSATWRSVEGPDETSGDAAWPASPVIVELSPVPSAAAVVGVGRAGKSHYSVSFTAKPADSSTASEAARLIVECACRIHEPPRWIGSTYEPIGSDGRPGSLVRIPAAIASDLAGPLPRTVTWSYVFGPTGPVPCHRPG